MRDKTPSKHSQSLLCLSPPERAGALSEIVQDLGFSAVCATTREEVKEIKGFFPLALVDMHGQPDNPFDMFYVARLAEGRFPALRCERYMTLENMEEVWGLQRAYAIRCSSYCRLDLDANNNITEKGRHHIAAEIRDVLDMPPYEDVSYYEEVPETAIHGLIESSQAPILVLQPDHRIWFANLAAQATFRRPTHLLKGLPVTELFATQQDAETFMDIVRNIDKMAGANVELRMKTRNLLKFDALLIINRVFYGDPLDKYVGFTLHDITQRRKAENALKKSEENFAALFENGPDGLLLADGQDRILQVNDAFCQALGYERKELLNRRTLDLELLPDGRREIRASLTRSLRGSKAGKLLDYRRKDGSLITLEVCETLLKLPGRRRSTLISFRDVTERKRAEDTLRESERRFRELLQNLQMVAVTLDISGATTFCNDFFLRLTGRKREETLGANWFDLFIPPEDRTFRSLFSALIQGQEHSTHHENDILTAAGERRRIAWNNTILRSPQGEIIGMTGIGEDITERRRLEDQLRQAQKMEAIGQLAGGIAHDFNNLLTGILGNLTLAQTETHPEVMRPLLAEAERASLRAASLVKQLLAFSRRSHVVMKSTDLTPIIEEVAEIARNTFDRRIEIHTQVQSQLRPVLADAGQMHQILLNLCVNARDALEQMERSEEEVPDLRLVIEAENVDINEEYCQTHGEASLGRYVQIRVIDTGKGMPPEVLQHLFEPFYTTKEMGKGTGLGLATVYGIVKQHQGWINVYSEINQGTVFNVFLPATESSAETPADSPYTEVPGGDETILVVDDEEVIRNVAEAILNRLGYTVLLASDGKEGLNRFLKERNRIDLVLLDLSMPFLSGREVLEQIRAVDPDARVILSSGYALDGRVDELDRLNASGYVGKPYRLAELACTIRQVLDER